MFGLFFEATWRRRLCFHQVIVLFLAAAAPPTVDGYFLGDIKAVLNGCEDHWALRDSISIPRLPQMTVCVNIRVVVPGPWVAFSYSSIRTLNPDLGLEGDDKAIYGWLLQVKHRFPFKMSPMVWHRVCLRRDIQRNIFSLEVDHIMVAERTVIAQAINPSGSLWLGCHQRNRSPGGAVGKVELYLFRMWADLGEHRSCEDGTEIGWNANYWDVTSPNAKETDHSLPCDHKRLRRASHPSNDTASVVDSVITSVAGSSRVFPAETSYSDITSPAVVSTTPPDRSSANQVPRSTSFHPITALPAERSTAAGLFTSGTQVTCNISQLCSNKSAYYWIPMSVKAEQSNKTEQDLRNLVSEAFDCNSTSNEGGFNNFCQANGQLQVVEVTCRAKPAATESQTMCNVLLFLSQAMSACDLQHAGNAALQRAAGSLQPNITGNVERVGRTLCEDGLPSSGDFVRCTSTSSLDEICQLNRTTNVTCSVLDTNSVAAPQQTPNSCSGTAPRFCNCSAFCETQSQLYAIKIKITSNITVLHLKHLLLKSNILSVCIPKLQGVNCSDILSKHTRTHLECYGEMNQRFYSCMVVLEMSGPVNSCSLRKLVRLLIEKEEFITTDDSLSRMMVCGGPPDLSGRSLLASNLNWSKADLLPSDVCQPGSTLIKCEANQTLAVLLADSCPPDPQTTSTTQTPTQSNSLTSPTSVTHTTANAEQKQLTWSPNTSFTPPSNSTLHSLMSSAKSSTVDSKISSNQTVFTTASLRETKNDNVSTAGPIHNQTTATTTSLLTSTKTTTELPPIYVPSTNVLPSSETKTYDTSTVAPSTSHLAVSNITTPNVFTNSGAKNNETTANNKSTKSNIVANTTSNTSPPSFTNIQNVTAPVSNYTKPYITTSTYDQTTTYNVTTPDRTDHHLATPTNNSTLIHYDTTPSNKYTTSNNEKTPTNNRHTTAYNATTISYKNTAIPITTTLSNNYTTELKATNPQNIQTTTQNPTSTDNNTTDNSSITSSNSHTTENINLTTDTNATTPGNNYTTEFTATKHNNQTPIQNATTPTNHYTTPSNPTTLTDNQTVDNSTIPSNNHATLYAAVKPNNYTTIQNPTTPSNNYKSPYSPTTPWTNSTSNYNTIKPSNNHTTSYTPTTLSDNSTIIYNTVTPNNNLTTLYNIIASSKSQTTTNNQALYNTATLSNNYTTKLKPTNPNSIQTTTQNPTSTDSNTITSSNNHKTLYATVKPNNYTTVHNPTTLSNNPITPSNINTELYNATIPSDNHTTFYKTTTISDKQTIFYNTTTPSSIPKTPSNYNTTFYNATTITNTRATVNNVTPTRDNHTAPSGSTTVRNNNIMIYNTTTPSDSHTTFYNATTPSSNNTMFYNPTTTSNNNTTPSNPTISSNKITPSNPTTSNNNTTFYNPTTSSHNTTLSNPTTTSNNNTTSSNSTTSSTNTTPSNPVTTTNNNITPSNLTTSNNNTTPSNPVTTNNNITPSNLTTSNNNTTPSEPTTSNNNTTPSKPTTSNNNTTPSKPTTSNNNTTFSKPTTSNNNTTPSNSTTSNNNTTPSKPTTSNNNTTFSYPTTSSNNTTFSNPTTSSNNTTPSNPTTSNNNTTPYNLITSNNNTTPSKPTTSNNNTTSSNSTTTSSNNTTPSNLITSNNNTTPSNPVTTSSNNTMFSNPTTSSNNNTMPSNLTTSSDNTTPSNLITSNNNTTPSNPTTTSSNNTTLSNPTTTSSNNTTPFNLTTSNNNTMLSNLTTSNNNTTPSNPVTTTNSNLMPSNPTSNNSTTPSNSTTSSNNNTTPFNLITSNNNTTPFNLITSNNNTTPSNLTTSNNNTTLSNPTTSSNNTTHSNLITSNNNTTPSKPTTSNNNTSSNPVTTTNNNTTPANPTSNNSTTTSNLITSNNNTTASNLITSNNNTTPSNPVTTTNSNTAPSKPTTSNNNTTPSKPTTSNNSTTSSNPTTPSNNHTAPYIATMASYLMEHNTTTINKHTTGHTSSRSYLPESHATTPSSTSVTENQVTTRSNHMTASEATQPSTNLTTLHKPNTSSNNYTTNLNIATITSNFTNMYNTTLRNDFASASPINTTSKAVAVYNTTKHDDSTTLDTTTKSSINYTTATEPPHKATTSFNMTIAPVVDPKQNTTSAKSTTVVAASTKVTTHPHLTTESKTSVPDNTKPTEASFINRTENQTTVSVTHLTTVHKNDSSSTVVVSTIQENKPLSYNSATPVIAATASTTTTTHNPTNKSTTTTSSAKKTTLPTTKTTTTAARTGTTLTTTVNSSTKSKEEQANQLLDQTDVSKLNSSQVSKLLDNLEKVLMGPTVSESVGQKVLDVISNLINGDQEVLSGSTNRLIHMVDNLALKLEVAGGTGVLSSASLVLAVKTVDWTNFPETSVEILDTNDVQLRRVRRSRVKRSAPALGSVDLPSSIISGLSHEEKQQASRVQFTFYKNNSLFKDSSLDNQTAVSPVLGSSVANLSISNLKENVTFTITHSNLTQDNVTSCVFWNFTKKIGSGGWDDTGCFVVSATPEYTTCSCNHLTSFAILMDLSREGTPDPQQAMILTFITYIGCGISAVFLAVTLITYMLFEKLLRDIPAKILVQLCLSLLLLNLIFLLDGWLSIYENINLCISTAFFLHYFLLSSFTWAGLEALHMYLSIVRVFTPYLSKYMLKFSLMGWGIPLIVVVIIVAVDKNNYGLVPNGKYEDGTSDKFCWLRNDVAFYVGVVAYFLLIFVLCLAVFIVVMVQLSRIKKQNPHNQSPNRSAMTDIRSIIGLVLLLGLTWGFALFAWGEARLAFLYLFTICNSLLGLFIFIFHCAVKENVRRMWRTFLCCGNLRLAENSEWSHTATQNKLSAATATTSANQLSNRSSSFGSNLTNSNSSVFVDSGISERSNSDVVLNEVRRRSQSLQGEP